MQPKCKHAETPGLNRIDKHAERKLHTTADLEF